MKDTYDVAIIGAGVAGAFASLRIAEQHKDLNTILIDLGKRPGKRRRFLEGWFGCFPTGDGKLYTNDVNKVLEIADGRKTRGIDRWINNLINNTSKTPIIKNKKPNKKILSEIKKYDYELELCDYMQWIPNDIHQLSRYIADYIENSDNITFSFDNEVFGIQEYTNEFIIDTNDGQVECKKIILCTGRSGWRWVNELYRELGILLEDDQAKYGITLEIASQYLKDFNKSHCILKKDNLLVGPVSWGGSIIQEDHVNLTTAAFRSNEGRWKSDKTFFSLINFKDYPNEGCKQTDRIAQLSFLLSGERVGREKVRSIIRKSSQISMLPEYNWLIPAIEELDKIFPNLINRGFFHYPDILPLVSKIEMNNNLESTQIKNLFVAGENAGLKGILSAAITGGIAADSVAK